MIIDSHCHLDNENFSQELMKSLIMPTNVMLSICLLFALIILVLRKLSIS